MKGQCLGSRAGVSWFHKDCTVVLPPSIALLCSLSPGFRPLTPQIQHPGFVLDLCSSSSVALPLCWQHDPSLSLGQRLLLPRDGVLTWPNLVSLSSVCLPSDFHVSGYFFSFLWFIGISNVLVISFYLYLASYVFLSAG